MPFLMSFPPEHEIVTFAWIDNASVQFSLNIYAAKGYTRSSSIAVVRVSSGISVILRILIFMSYSVPRSVFSRISC